ncbi:Myosin-2A [Zancudomyces culisetae]|uniref:Myosin-2A n=1 Tax=Zancudomyces culisetae TaxID=1213189 RepID=A0A1R1PRK6_ZANCU|nr:Myosin-2A [Zancudomyces culisetae]|eukprot:OMH83581.1 Myosin-2A [Zancudomyces culisetae]
MRNSKRTLRLLKSEAKSVEHFKSVSFKLESRLVDCTRQLQAQEIENSKLSKKCLDLEADVSKWRLKFDESVVKFDEFKKDSDQTLADASNKYDLDLKAVKKDLALLSKANSQLTDEMATLNELLSASKQSTSDLQLQLDNLVSSSDAERASLTEKIDELTARLKEADAQLEYYKERYTGLGKPLDASHNPAILMQPPVRKPSGNDSWKWDSHMNSGYERLSRDLDTQVPHIINPDSSTTIAGMTREDSRRIKGPDDSTNIVGSDSSPTQYDSQLYTNPNANANPNLNTSSNPALNGSLQYSEPDFMDGEFVLRTEEEAYNMLESDDGLISEVLTELIGNLNIPLPSLDTEYSPAEILFPSHLIGLCVIKMFQFNLSSRIEKLLMACIALIQKKTMNFESDFLAAFWLSNVFELLSIVKTSMTERISNSPDYAKSENAMNESVQFLESLLSDIYFGWVKNLQRRFIKLIVPAVVENEALPGFTTSDSSFFNRIMGSVNKDSSIKIENILNFFNNVWRIMEFYYVDIAIMQQIFSELLCTIGITAFNNIVMRRNFCSWKRGMQIQYNLTRIEEWCKAHSVSDNTKNLDRLLQLVKLLQLPKSTKQDIDVIFEACDLLNPAQIKKLLSIYSVSDYENPILSPVMPEIARRAAESEKSDNIFLDTNDMNDQVLYLTARKIESVGRVSN